MSEERDVTGRHVYLDHHATTPLDPRVRAAIDACWQQPLGNPSNPTHHAGRAAAEAVAHGREQVAQLLGVSEREVVFTSGATEANNLAIKGVLRAARPGSQLVVSAIEHPSVLEAARRMERHGYGLTIVPVDRTGRVDPDDVAAAIRPETVLVSIIAASHEVGTIQPLAEIGAMCRERGVLLHTDATQALGRISVNIEDCQIDLLSASAHKLYGPMGIGLLMVRRRSPRIPLEPLFDGGSQEHQRRAGTVPTALVVAFGVACELAEQSFSVEPQRLIELRERLWCGLSARIADIQRNGSDEHRLPGNLHVSIPDIDGDALLAGLDNIACSAGAACSATSGRLSHVLHAIGLSDELSKSSLRFGIGRFNTSDDIDLASDTIAAIAQRLRSEQIAHIACDSRSLTPS